jgi:beta-galactosidase
MGVGGDTSWGALTHKEYRLTEKAYSYSFRIKAISSDDNAEKLARMKF